MLHRHAALRRCSPVCRVGIGLASLALVWVALPSRAPVRGSELRRTAIVKAVERVRDAVVNIHGEKELSDADLLNSPDGERHVNGMGTGVVLDPRGYIVTNHHVVEGVKKINVTLADGETYIARIVSRDPQTDLAVVKIDVSRPLPVIACGTSSDLMPGEPVIAVGNAFGYQHTVTRGIISALHRTVEVGEGQQYEDLIQTDASINPGNSGGPLLNIDGELIGINVAVRAGAQGIGFAIPVDKVLSVATELLSVRRIDHTWHGLVVSRQADRQAEGVVVAGVADDSPAVTTGLEVGDVIVRVGRSPVQRPLDLECALLGHRAGDGVELEVRRGSETIRLPLKLAGAPARGISTSSEPSWDLLGMRLAPISSKKFREFATQYRGGLLVTAVRPDSPAAEQGIRRGDVLVGMHIWETVSLENVTYILNHPDLADFEPMKFYILRDRHTLFGHLQVSGSATR